MVKCEMCGGTLKEVAKAETPQHRNLWLCTSCAFGVDFQTTKRSFYEKFVKTLERVRRDGFWDKKGRTD